MHLSGTWLLCVLLFPRWSSGRMSVINRKPANLTTLEVSKPEEMTNFLTCPVYRANFREFCRRGSLSCVGRCGSNFKAVHGGFPQWCSCDSLCSVYGDCCWDFEHVCPDELDEFLENFSPLANARSQCVMGQPLIVGVRETKGSEPVIDYRRMVVSDREYPGLHFLNEDVYRSFYGNQGDFIRWEKKIEASTAFTSHDIQQFLNHGTFEGDAEKFLTDVPPSGTTEKRHCMPGVHIKCPHVETCPGDTKEILITDGDSNAYCHIYNKSQTSQELGMVLENELCPVELQSNTIRKHTPAFSLVIAFSDYSGLVISDFDPGFGRWKSVDLITDQESPDNPKQLWFNCEIGLVFSSLFCRRPEWIHVYYTSNVNSYEALYAYSRNITVAILDTFHGSANQPLILGFQMKLFFETSQKLNLLYSEGKVDIEKFDLTYNGTILPFTSTITQLIKDRADDDSVQDMIICLELMGTSFSGSKNWICDHLSGAEGTHIRHFRQVGESFSLEEALLPLPQTPGRGTRLYSSIFLHALLSLSAGILMSYTFI